MTKLLLLVLVFYVGCSGISHQKTYTLRMIGEKVFEPGTTFEKLPFGGLSGIAYNKQSKQLIAISDDRSERGPARFYHLDLELSETRFDVIPTKMTLLKSANGRNFPKGEVDFEGIALTPSGDIVLSSEGDNRPSPRIPPSIMLFNNDGSYKGWVTIPEHYLPEHKGTQTRGPRNNKALESLGITPGGRYLFTGPEDTMVQDGDMATQYKEGVLRLTRFKRKSENFVLDKEFAYSLDKVPGVPGKDNTAGINGLVELIPISKNHLFSMERAWNPENRKQTIKIFKVTIGGATDVSHFPSLVESEYTKVRKELIVNLDDFVPLLVKGKKKLDNIEGFALGPILPNGNPTLIVISDDNFNKHQRTLLLAFEIL